MLYLIGLGLGDEMDITVRGAQIIKQCKKIYLEQYTSTFSSNAKQLEKVLGKKIEIAYRETIEQGGDDIVKEAKKDDIALLVIGDPLCATTHNDIRMRAQEAKVAVKIIHNASIISAIAETGLDVYKFGRVTTIPFGNEHIKSPLEVLEKNYMVSLHTLFLFDLDPLHDKYMTLHEAIEYLVRNGIKKSTFAIGVAALGKENQLMMSGTLEELQKKEITAFPQCLIIPAKMSFYEEECVKEFCT